MTVDRQLLLKDLKRQVRLLEDDIRDRSSSDVDVDTALRDEHRAALEVGRTATTFTAWRDTQVTQAAVAWVLATVFVRFCEDNGLVEHPWIAGPGHRTRDAAERQTRYFLDHPDRNERDWLRESFEHLASFPALAPLLDRQHNPLHRLEVSADGAHALVEMWRRVDDAGTIVHDLSDADLSTRFLGDLYQDLSDAAKKQYALLQTPEFVESFILGLTLDPAIDTFGLDGLRTIDPTCGSGHFLLGTFHRLLAAWTARAPGMDVRERVQKVLDSVHGVDVNPFASAIARFRLTVAALKASGVERLAEAPGYRFTIGTGDSLLKGVKQDELFDSGLSEHLYASEDLAEHPSLLDTGTYHVVVGNPPYITVKDKALNEAYREGYKRTVSGKYALSVPFAELFFRLAVRDQERPGFVGQITSNSFMKREFGKKLVEEHLPTLDLTHVIDTSGAYIPGHGTPTVILVGRRRTPRSGTTLRAVLGIRGEPSSPASPADGLVWRSIVDHLDKPGHEDDYVSVSDMDRARLAAHPWSLSGGGADDLKTQIESSRPVLRPLTYRIGVFGIMGGDDAMMLDAGMVTRRGLESRASATLVVGDAVRDWGIRRPDPTFFPYGPRHELLPLEQFPRMARLMWPMRTELGNRATFSRQTYFQEGRPWYEWHQLPVDEGASELTISLAFVATHNHFVLDRGGKVFKQSAPVIKLPEGATEEEHLALLGVLNSSTGCLWLKQVCHNKGGGGIGGGIASEDWEQFYEFTGTKLKEFPIPASMPAERAQLLDRLASVDLWHHDPRRVAEHMAPARAHLDEARRGDERTRRTMVMVQEEMDWEVYSAYGIVDEDLTWHGDVDQLDGLALGERAFEIALARRAASGEVDTAWFERHRSTPITEIPDHWPDDYRRLVERRLELIGDHPFLRLLERPECKRRWAHDTWEVREKAALRDWLLDRLEQPGLWRDRSGRPQVQSVAQLADKLAADADLRGVLDLWAGQVGVDVAPTLARLLSDEHVPFLAALRYKEPGLRTREAWEETWRLQRREDAGEKVGPIAVPPRYKPADFVRTSYWRHRGKLDVPKERFISYPGAEVGADTSLVLGWAGWDHAEQALALATVAIERARSQGWDAERLIPLWAGVAELEPWVQQWHHEVDPAMGSAPSTAVTGLLETHLQRLGLTRESLTSWRPPAPTRGRRAARTQEDPA